MSSKETVAEKSLVKLMQFLKNEEVVLQNKIPLLQSRLTFNRTMQVTFLKIIAEEEKKVKQEEEKLKEEQVQEKFASLRKAEREKKEKDFREKMAGKCIFKKHGSKKFCEKETVKSSKYCIEHRKE